MGTNADKHARQKQRRNRVDEARRQVELKARRRRTMTIVAAVIAVLALIGAVVVLFTGNDTDETADDASTDTTTTTTAAPVELPAPPPGATLTGPTECPPADGAAERVQVFAGPPPECIDPAATYTATFRTSEGDFTAELDTQAAPDTVNNFVVLSRYGYYDGVPFHRIVPGFVIQAGDGDGEPWGSNDLGYSIDDELPADASAYTDYSMAMANAGPNTNGSQFFVVLPGGGATFEQVGANYTVFGQVTQGQDVVDTIGALGSGEAPTKAVVIESVEIAETPAA